MKAPWFAVFLTVLLCAVAIAAKWNWDADIAAKLEKQITDLQAQNAKLNQELVDANDRAKMLASESAQLRAAQQQPDQTAAAPIAAATPEPPKAKGNNFLTQMMKDPQMRKAIASQQAAAMRGFYSDFVKQANLTPDQAEQFFKLLGDRMTAQMDLGANMLSGSGGATTLSATNDSDAALKNLLGTDGFSSFQSYEKSLGSRIEVQQLGQQLSSEGIGLQDYQNTALTQIMSEEQAAMPKFNTPGANQQLATMSDAQVDQYQQQLQATDQQIYNRAMSVLTPPQLSALSAYQKNMETMQIAGMKMAKQMFNSGQ